MIAAAMAAVNSQAQWVHYPTAGIPRTKDGKPNLSAPTPRTKDGKPDLTAPAQSLSAFAGKAIGGAWKLKVRDLAAADTGTLNSWEIDFRAP